MTEATATIVPRKKLDPEDVKKKVELAVHKLLGRPADHYRTDVVLYQGHKARINIWRRQPTKKKGLILTIDEVTITDSFFLTLSPKGEILDSNPPVQKRY